MVLTEHRQRDVHAHGGGGLGAVPGHGEDGVLDLLIGVAEGLVQPVPQLLGVGLHPLVGDGEVLQIDQMGVQPLAVGLLAGVAALQLAVVHQAALPQVGQQHPAGLEPGFLHDFFGGNIQYAHLGGQNELVTVGEVPAAGPQAVAVQNRAHGVAVGEHDGGGAVPGLHHGGVVVVEVPLLPLHLLVVGPGLGNAHHHRLGQVDAVHHQEFKRVVQHGTVGTALVDDGQDLVHIILHDGGGHGFLPGQHTVHVAPDGVDLAVVHDVAVGMGPLPAGVRVGGEPGVDQGDGALAVRVRQVRVEFAELAHQEHALVDDGPAGERGNVRIDVGLLEHPAGHIQLSIEVQTFFAVGGALHKALADGGHTGQGLFAQHLRVGGNIPPAQEFHALLGHDDLHHLLGLGTLEAVIGEEEHAHAVVPLATQGDAVGGCGLYHQLMRDLEHQAHAVAGLSSGVLAGAVLQLFHDFQGVVHGLIGFIALQVHHRADAAGIVLKPGGVEGVVFLVSSRHRDHSNQLGIRK